jgi:ATP-dependent Clp endopeptidase proteolytic subunit ClpP
MYSNGSNKSFQDEEFMSKDDKKSSGEIWVNKFNEEAASHFREQILAYALKDPNLPIIIYIDSYGGYVDALAKMIDTLEQIDNPTITVCMGKAVSCGAILLSHGHLRYCAPNSRVMVHEVSSGTFGDVHDMYNDAVEVKRLNKHFLGLLARNCGFKGGFEELRKFIKQKDGRDLWMNPQEALKFGIIDDIGTPTIIPQISYQIGTIKAAPRQDKVNRSFQILGVTTRKKKK